MNPLPIIATILALSATWNYFSRSTSGSIDPTVRNLESKPLASLVPVLPLEHPSSHKHRKPRHSKSTTSSVSNRTSSIIPVVPRESDQTRTKRPDESVSATPAPSADAYSLGSSLRKQTDSVLYWCRRNMSTVNWTVITPVGYRDPGVIMPPARMSPRRPSTSSETGDNDDAHRRKKENVQLFNALQRETGVPTLRKRFEEVSTWECRKRSWGPADVIASSAPLPVDQQLALPDRFVNFSEFIAASWPTSHLNASTQSLPFTSSCLPISQYPYMDGAGFVSLADYAHFVKNGKPDYYAKSRPLYRLPFLEDFQSVKNRSLVYFEMCPGNGIKRLHELLRERPDLYFFLMTHIHFCNTLPMWTVHHPRILKVFVVNCRLIGSPCYHHNKVVCLPMGIPPRHADILQNLSIANAAQIRTNRKFHDLVFRDPNSFLAEPTQRLYISGLNLGHYGNLKGSRVIVVQQVRKAFNVSSMDARRRGKGVDPYIYLSTLRNFRFVFSPPGSAVDTYRFWESLYLGRVPVAMAALFGEVYQDLPILLRARLGQTKPKELDKGWKVASQFEYNIGKLSMRWWVVRILRECLMVP